MLTNLHARVDYGALPTGLRRYVITVAMLGPLVAIGLVLAQPAGPDARDWLLMAMLVGLAAAAEGHPLHLTHKTSVNVSTAVSLAMLLILPWHWVPLLALTGALGGQFLRLRANPALGLAEPLFNIGQAALYVACGSAAARGLLALAGRAWPGHSRELAVLIIASTVFHVVNTGLVAGAAALQMGLPPTRVWSRNLTLDLMPHVTLTVLGGIAARLAEASPILLPTLVVPGILIHRAVSQTVRLRVDTHEALASLVEVVELRDPYTAGHSRRVAATARLIALKLGLTAEEADLIESAGRVHDIGKVAIDPAVLTKPGRLTEAEWAQMKLHPVYGANVVDRFVAYQDGAALVRHHHEAWDGSGYPDGLAGEAIPLGARILAVADTFDALTSDRPYRDGMSVARARAILEEGVGSQWEGRVVEALLAQLAEDASAVPLYRRPERAPRPSAGPSGRPALQIDAA